MQAKMKPTLLTLALVGCLGLPFLRAASPEASGSTPQPAVAGAAWTPALESQYIGASKCKSCHKSEESGNQYEAWEKASHSHAFEVLASDASKAAASAAGIADAQKADECLKCHVTGHGAPESAIKKGFKFEEGVQCESCHGPGGDHMKARFAAAAGGEAKEGYQGAAVSEMITSPGVEVCTQCHNPESPSYKPFCFYEARGKVAHLDPRKPRSDEEKANYGVCPHGAPCPHAEGCPDGTCNLTPEKLAALKQ